MAGLALITGASRGIGRALALDLARRGWNLGLTGRDAAALAQVAADCSAIAPRAVVVHRAFDIRDADAFAGLLDDLTTQLGAIDLYLSNHGILDGRSDGAMVETAAAAAAVLDINLTASVAALHLVLDRMREAGGGRIGIVASLGGLSPLADAPAYSASKAGLIFYGLALRDALRDTGIKVSVLCPGYVATDMAAEHEGARPRQMSADAAARRILDAVMKGRRLVGFPFPMFHGALLANLVPEPLFRLFSGGLRFSVRRRAEP